MNWQDYFYFTKPERNGIIILLIIIGGIIAYPFLYDRFHEPDVYDYSSFSHKVEKYEQRLAEYHAAQKEFDKRKEAENVKTSILTQSLNLQMFDPNNTSQSEMQQMGFSQRVISNIINYRRAGGAFKYKEDVKRIYGISEQLYEKIEPFLELPLKPAAPVQISHSTPVNEPYKKQKPEILIGINKADTIDWQKIKGIGPVFSRRIASYRDLLGGFHSTDQLKEIFGMDSVRFATLAPHVFLDTMDIRKININTADFATMVRHPYLNRNQVNSIIRIREQHGNYHAIDEIKKSDLITEDDFQRLAPYLSTQ
jgi:competence protein ComEA